MKESFSPLLMQAMMLLANLDDNFLELGTVLHKLSKEYPADFKKLCSLPQLGRRKAYYLISIDKAFADKNEDPKRLKDIGWTKLAALAPHVTADNWQDALLFAEMNTVRNIEAVGRGQEPNIGGRSVLLLFTADQFAIFADAIVKHGAIANGAGFVGKEAALIAVLSKNRS
jgi:hypothetical protein